MARQPSYVTIGKVVKRLQASYPDLTVSKVRYLEEEGLLNLQRTAGGYRLFSPDDIKRLETILYLQKSRFLPLSVIKEELEGSTNSVASGINAYPQAMIDDPEITERLHPIERMPELIGVSVVFVRQLAQSQLINLKVSPKGRDLVDGKDFALIRSAEALRHFGVEPRNLKQYVMAANRESFLFEQVLSFFAPKSGKSAQEAWEERTRAFDQILTLTGNVRSALIRRNLENILKRPPETSSQTPKDSRESSP